MWRGPDRGRRRRDRRFTSGTTGRPKAARHFHRDVLAIADAFSARVLRPVADDVFAGGRAAFTYGLGGLLVFPLRAGGSVLLLEKAAPDELAGRIAARGVTVCIIAPTGYRAMIASGGTSTCAACGSPCRPGAPYAGQRLEPCPPSRSPGGRSSTGIGGGRCCASSSRRP